MQYDETKYEIWKLPHGLLLHWILNPGIMVNEIFLGQRQPAVTLIDKSSNAPLMERAYIPCEHCGALNDSRLWAKGNAFGHWFGFVCPECGGKIKCIWNVFSLAVLAVTFPIWILLKWKFEQQWLEAQSKRLQQMKNKSAPTSQSINWLKMGLIYGAFMFFVMTITTSVFIPITLKIVAIQAVLWLVAGLAFGGIMKLTVGTKGRKPKGGTDHEL